MPDQPDFTVPSLGERKIRSPLSLPGAGAEGGSQADEGEFVRLEVLASPGPQAGLERSSLLEKAGPRRMIYFSPSHVHAGIVTCGGLCPGLNDVIRSVVRCLWYRYGVRRVTGVRYGYKGFLPEYGVQVKELGPDLVDDIHKAGGSILGSSRGGGGRTADIVDAIERLNMNMLFTIGGDGTQKGAAAIADEIGRRGLKIAVVGIPKTIDNDFSFVDRSFGFETAVERACDAVACAHAEAHSYQNGVGLVKVMGRESGFIAVHTVLASHESNFVLVPEVPFDLEGPAGLLARLEERLAARGHAVIVVAEGAGQEHASGAGTDASGNKKLGDIGIFLRDRLQAHFAARGLELNLKYIDPSYMVRSARANPSDSLYCERLGAHAVHAAMAGKTKVLIGMVNREFVHIPMLAAAARRSRVDPSGALWRDALEATRQPVTMKNGETS